MAPELIYMLKVNAGIALFYAFYKLFCCNDTFFRWRRTALLSFLALSFLYPLLNIQAWVKEQPAIYELADYYSLLITNSTNTNDEIITATAASSTPSLMTLFLWTYFAGVALFSVRFIIQLLSIFRLSIISKDTTVNGIRVKKLPTADNPFSFWHWIFIYLPDLKENETQEILTHEQTHARQLHSFDVIVSEVANIICWMNPFMWLLKDEIRLNLEYLADHKVMESGANRQQYQYHLLGLANQNKQTGLYNNFNLLHLKKRIIMMNKKRTCTTGRIKYALFAPLTAALLLMSNIETVARTTERITKEVAETIKAIQAPAPKVAEAPAVVYQDDDPIFNIVTEMPLFVDGGMGGCLKYLINNTKYPEQAQKDKISGKVAVKFVIEKDGSITNAKITKSDNPIFNEEALRVVNSMPKWKPGKQKGKEVRVYYTVPVMFSPNGNGYQKAMDSIEGKTQADNSDAKPKYGPNKDGSYNIVDVMPEFPGGMGACLKYIMSHAKYPAEAQAKKQQGKVLVQCIIEKDGTVSNPTIMEGVSPELNEEAVRIIKSMPRWMPGKHKGKAVPVRYTLPVIFRLQ